MVKRQSEVVEVTKATRCMHCGAHPTDGRNAELEETPSNWVFYAAQVFCIAAIYLVFFVHRGSNTWLIGARRDIVRMCCVGALCALEANFIPTSKRLRCVMVFMALKWAMERSQLRDLLQSQNYGLMKRSGLHLVLRLKGRAAKTLARSVHNILCLYSWFIDFMSLFGFRWRKHGPSLDALDLDNGTAHVLEDLLR